MAAKPKTLPLLQGAQRVVVLDSEILLDGVSVRSNDVVEFVRGHQESEREDAVVRALEVGVFCLDRVGAARDLDFVRSQLNSLLAEVEKAVAQIPTTVEASLVQKIGMGEGQVLAPVRSLVAEASASSGERVRQVQTFLAEEIDPSKESTTLGRALRVMTDLLDARRTDSVQATIQAAVQSVSSPDGQLTAVVKKVVTEAVAPLGTEISRLALEFRGEQAAEEVLQQTTAKGATYEARVVVWLAPWARVSGARISHVGSDNRPGDLVIEIPDPVDGDIRIVIEARDRKSALGRKAVAETLDRAMSERGCTAAIYVSQCSQGLTAEIGEWAEGTCAAGDFVATTHEHLLTALRFLLVQRKLARMKETQHQIDELAVRAQLRRIHTALKRVASIKRRVSEVRVSADGIQLEGEALRDDVRAALIQLEDAVRVS